MWDNQSGLQRVIPGKRGRKALAGRRDRLSLGILENLFLLGKSFLSEVLTASSRGSTTSDVCGRQDTRRPSFALLDRRSSCVHRDIQPSAGPVETNRTKKNDSKEKEKQK